MAENNKKKKTCFIITPIGNVNSSTRRKIDGLIEEVIKPAIGDEYEILVSHKSLDSGSMTKYIIQSIYNSDLVIANLTDQNPNVMYEVAFRHACAKPIIHITEDVSELPFDISDHRTIEYVDDIHGVGDLKKKLINMVGEIEKGDKPISNPIIDNLNITNIIPKPQVQEVDIIEAIKQLSNKIDKTNDEIKNREQRVIINPRSKSEDSYVSLSHDNYYLKFPQSGVSPNGIIYANNTNERTNNQDKQDK